MFKHILIPTDGSELSKMAVIKAVQFAKEINAKVTGLTVTVPYHYFAVDAIQLVDTPEQYAIDVKVMAEKNLNVIKEEAIKAGVIFDLIYRSNEHPYEEIVKTAQDFMCDVIFLASHGRRGMSGFLLGSETQKVLTHSKIPVVVYR
ncbi:MAG: universal stress protein [Burkholderiaceae bacterium]